MSKSPQIVDLASLTLDHFGTIKDEEVMLQHPNGKLKAVVKQVTALKKSKGCPGREQPFSIIFQCDDHFPPIQAVVQIEHPTFCLERVLVTPTLKPMEEIDSPHIYFEAVFT